MKLKYVNKIKMNCANFVQDDTDIPPNCYSCAMRNGWPKDLGGDRKCINFKPIKNETKN